MSQARFIVSAAVTALLMAIAARDARAACIPLAGQLGGFPAHMDSDIPLNAHFIFEIASFPTEATGVSYELRYATSQIPGDFRRLFPIGPVGSPHSRYLYEFKPRGATETMDTYVAHLRYTLAGKSTQEDHSSAFSMVVEPDTTPPAFEGIAELFAIHGSPDNTVPGSGYDCLLGEGIFLVVKLKIPPPDAAEMAAFPPRRDGVIFTSYESSESGTIGKITSRSVVWPKAYAPNPPPVDWTFVVEVSPPPDIKRCFVVRATDATGNEESNTVVKCVSAPGPSILIPGAGHPGFFGPDDPPTACNVSGSSARWGAGATVLLVAAASAVAARNRRRR